MAKKPNISTISSGYQSTTTINSNFQNIRDSFDNTISRDGSTPNEMQADLDMNSNDILNVKSLETDELIVNNLNLSTIVQDTQDISDEISATIAPWLGTRTTDPTTRNDSTPLQNGDYYFNTGSNRTRTYANGIWYDIDAGGNTSAPLVAYTKADGSSSNAETQLRTAETSAELINVELRKARRTFKKLFDSSNSIQQVKLLSLGDSLKDRQNVHFVWALDRKLGGTIQGWVNNANINPNVTAGADAFFDNLVSVTGYTNAFEYVPSGSLSLIADGGSIRLIYGGVNLSYTTVKAFYIKEPGAGTINITNGGVVVASANASSATTELGVLTHTKALGQVDTRITATGGPVRLWFAHFVNGFAGVDFYQNFGAGGISPAQSFGNATTRAVCQAALTEIVPDLITIQFDDDWLGTSADTQLSNLFSILDNGAPVADKLFIGPQPRAASDTTRKASNERLRREISNKSGPYLYYDTYRIMGTYAEMQAALGADDGVHPTAAAAALGASAMFQVLGLDSSLVGYQTQPVRTPHVSSRLFRDTTLIGGVSEFKVSTDATFGYDWSIVLPRTLSFNINSSVAWQFSGNTAVFPNIVPANFKWNTAASPLSLESEVNAYFSRINFKDTGTVKGLGVTGHEYITFASYTKAELPPANVRTPAIIYCSNAAASGGGCFLYSMGDFYWRRISDDAQVIP